jgi:hypothetical protein
MEPGNMGRLQGCTSTQARARRGTSVWLYIERASRPATPATPDIASLWAFPSAWLDMQRDGGGETEQTERARAG